MSVIYLLHFDTPLAHARHYIGYTDNLEQRLKAHRDGKGARLMAVLKQQGIGWELARVWLQSGRDKERRLKRCRNAPKYCPICRAARKSVQVVADGSL